jgi:hypothetical protein
MHIIVTPLWLRFPEMGKWYFFALSNGYIVTTRDKGSVIFQMSDVMGTTRFPWEGEGEIILQRSEDPYFCVKMCSTGPTRFKVSALHNPISCNRMCISGINLSREALRLRRRWPIVLKDTKSCQLFQAPC